MIGIGGAPTHPTTLPDDPVERKQYPIASGVLRYFPDAIVALAHLSYVGNDQHNPGEPLHWDRNKSTDEEDTLLRHLMEAGTFDKDGIRHSTKAAWRALAALQKEIEATKQAPVLHTEDVPRRASDRGEPSCPAQTRKDCNWTCERQAGHTGNHMAWKNYEDRRLYANGEWTNKESR